MGSRGAAARRRVRGTHPRLRRQRRRRASATWRGVTVHGSTTSRELGRRRGLAEPVLPFGAWRTAATTSTTTATSTRGSGTPRRTSTRWWPRSHARRDPASSSTSCRTTPRTGTRGSAAALDRPAGSRRARALHLPRRERARTAPSRRTTGSLLFGGSAWDPVGDGAVVPAPVRARSSPTSTGPDDEVREDFLTTLAVLGGPRRGRLPRRRRARAGQGPHRAPRPRPTALPTVLGGGAAPVLGPRRGARDLRRVAPALRRVRPAADRRRRGGGSPSVRRSRPVRQPRGGLGSGVQLRPAWTPTWNAASFRQAHRRRACGTSRRSRARRRRGCSGATTPSGCATRRATGCPREPGRRAHEVAAGAWLLTGGAAPPELGPGARASGAPGPGSMLTAGAAGLEPTSTRARSSGLHEVRGPARRGRSWRTRPGRAIRARRRKGRDGCRGAAAVERRRVAVVRLRAASATRLPQPRVVRRRRRRAPGVRPVLDARHVPGGARLPFHGRAVRRRVLGSRPRQPTSCISHGQGAGTR